MTVVGTPLGTHVCQTHGIYFINPVFGSVGTYRNTGSNNREWISGSSRNETLATDVMFVPNVAKIKIVEENTVYEID